MIILYLCNFISTLKQTKRRLGRVTLISRFRRYRTVQLHRKFGLTDREATISSIQKNIYCAKSCQGFGVIKLIYEYIL